jgi:hypothetical protein
MRTPPRRRLAISLNRSGRDVTPCGEARSSRQNPREGRVGGGWLCRSPVLPLPDPLWKHPRRARRQAVRRDARSLVQRARRRRSGGWRWSGARRRARSHRPAVYAAGTRCATTCSASITATASIAAAASIAMVAATRPRPATTLPAAAGFCFPFRKHHAGQHRRHHDRHAHDFRTNHHVTPLLRLRNGEPYEQRIRGPLAVTAPLSGTNNPDDNSIARQVDPISRSSDHVGGAGWHFPCQKPGNAHHSPGWVVRHFRK